MSLNHIKQRAFGNLLKTSNRIEKSSVMSIVIVKLAKGSASLSLFLINLKGCFIILYTYMYGQSKLSYIKNRTKLWTNDMEIK